MPSELRERVMQALPEKTLNLLRSIENYAGLEIEFGLNEHPEDASVLDPNLNAPACEATHERASILFRDGTHIDPHGVTHELLHIQRWWVDGVPQMMPVSGVNLGITSSMENTVEHLVIVPREATFGFEPYGHWNKTERALWSAYPWPEMHEPFARRKSCLLGWLHSDLVTEAEVIAMMREGLGKEGLMHEAERFRLKIRELLANKPRVVSCVTRFLNIPRHDVRLRYLDVRNRRPRIEPIPAH